MNNNPTEVTGKHPWVDVKVRLSFLQLQSLAC